jgi:hypothetical protein
MYLGPLWARNLAFRSGTPLVSAKCPEDASKFDSFREEPCLAAQANTEIVVHRQLIRCPAGSPSVLDTGPENRQPNGNRFRLTDLLHAEV